MKTYIRRREKNRELLLFYSGWGVDENIFASLINDDFDFILFYNYFSTEPLLLPEIKKYEKVTLIGWSMGVWAAQYLSDKSGIIPDINIAVNGTPLPADEKYGISQRKLEGTLNSLNEKNIKKFYYRMFGNKKTFMKNLDQLPHRDVSSLQSELRWMYNRIMESSETNYKWDYAIISEYDKVFPVKAQKLYWENQPDTKSILLPMNHFLFHNWNSLLDFIRYVETWVEPVKKIQRKIFLL